jgi:hypothetical protein
MRQSFTMEIVLVLLGFLSVARAEQPQRRVVSFQQGVAGYSGTVDT